MYRCMSETDLLLTIVCAATLRLNLQIKTCYPTQSFLTLGQFVLALSLYCWTQGKVASVVAVSKSLVLLDRGKWELILESAAFKVNILGIDPGVCRSQGEHLGN